MEQLSVAIETKIALKIEGILLKDDERRESAGESALFLLKRRRSSSEMLIRSSRCPSRLTLHICSGASRFHAYSKNGCVTFPVEQGTLVVTIGDRIQACVSGRYKHVIGKAVLGEGDCRQDAISIAFLYSGKRSSPTTTIDGAKIISLPHQVLVAACIILLYHSLVYIYANT